MRSGNAPRDQRRPDIEGRLISALSTLCGDGTSFTEITISELVGEAGLARATFYLYFVDRSAFVLRLVDHLRDRLAPAVSVLWDAALQSSRALEVALHEFIAIFAAERAVVAAVVATAASDPAVGLHLDAQMQTFITESVKVLEAAQTNGAVRQELSVHETAAAFVWMTERSCYQLANAGDLDAQKRLAQALAVIAWHALHDDPN